MKNRLRYARAIGRDTVTCSGETRTSIFGSLRLSGLAAFSIAAIGAIALAPAAKAQYCAAGSLACTAGNSDERITRVQFGAINNSSGTGAGPAGCYQDFTAMSANVDTGSTYALTVENTAPLSAYPPDDLCSAWFDWNHNNVFDAGEQVNLVGNVGQTVFTANVQVPASALAGATRFRVRLTYDDVAMSACGNANYGEVEDYSVFVTVVSTGACCTGTSCAIGNSTSCPPANFRGASTSCSPNICQGSCCDGSGNCAISAFNACSGPFIGAGTCSPNPCSYCVAGSAACALSAADERIAQFEFNDIINPASPDTGAAPGGCYTDWTSVGTTVFPGSTYTAIIHNPAPFTTDQAAVWIDFDHNFQFGNIASGEQFNLTIGDDNGAGVGSLFTGSITIPANAPLGTTRMRVRLMYTGTVSPCGTATYGEVEDYTITIQAPTVGACCSGSNGACTATTPGACASGFQGLATSCAPSNPCGGACCDTGGSCTVTDAAGCTGPGNSFANHGTCTTSICNGACCNATTGTCSFTNAAGCTNTFQSVGTVCSPNPCPQPPPPTNDDCATALPLLLDTSVSGTTFQSTQSVTATCTGSVNDVWYLFTAPAGGGSFAFTTTLTPGSITVFVPAIAIFDVCPASNGGNEAAPAGCQAQGGTGIVQKAGMAAGDQIWIRIADFAGDNTAFDLIAQTIVLGACCNDTTAACTIVTNGNCAGGTTYQGDNTSCSPTPCQAEACCNATTGVCSAAALGTCIFPATGQGLGTTCIPNPCPQPPPPDNDDCGTVMASGPNITDIGGSFACNLASSTNDGTACITALSRDVYFSFTPTVDGNWEFTTCIGSDAIDTVVSVHSGCPASPGNQIACNDDGCGLLSDLPAVSLSAGTQYLIRVALYSATGTPGSATLTVNPVTAGACCTDASGACVTVTNGACAAGTTYQGDNSVCGTAPYVVCGQGACCNSATGVCTVTVEATCTATANQTFQTAGTSCTVNPCPQPPTGACCDPNDGACTEVFAGNCPGTSFYHGDNSTCGAGCPVEGSCCNNATGACILRYGPSCNAAYTANASSACETANCTSQPHICENFDGVNPGELPIDWSSSSTGAGSPWVADSSQSNSPSNAVFTNDPGSVSSQYLVLPTVTAGNSGALTVDFWSYFDTEATFDGFVLEYSTDGGGTWVDVGLAGWALNPYNQAAISVNFQSPIAGRPAFSGVFLTWTEHIATIPASDGQMVMIRFNMSSDNSITHLGVYLDDICVAGISGGVGTGVCCRGSTCSTTVASSAACTSSVSGALAGSTFVAAASCNTGGSTTTPCCFPDYNKVNGIGVPDIFDFLNDWFAGKPFASFGGNGEPVQLAIQNIFDFLNAWFAGGCTP